MAAQPSSAEALALLRNTGPDGRVDQVGYEADRIVMQHQVVGGVDVDAVVRDMLASPAFRDAQGRIQAAPLVDAIGSRLSAPDQRNFDAALDKAGVDQGLLDKAQDALSHIGKQIGRGISEADRRASDFLADTRQSFDTKAVDADAPAWARTAARVGSQALGEFQEQYGFQKGALTHAYQAVEDAVDTVALAKRFATDEHFRGVVVGAAKMYAAATLDDPGKPYNDIKKAASGALDNWQEGLKTARAEGKEQQYLGETQGGVGFEAAMLLIPVAKLGKVGKVAGALEKGGAEGLSEAADIVGDAARAMEKGGQAARMADGALDSLVSAFRAQGGKLDDFVQATKAAGHLDDLLASGKLAPKEITTLARRDPDAFGKVSFDQAWEASLKNIGPVAKLSQRQTGDIAEAVITRDLMKQGYTDIVSIQNNSGWGVDVLGRNPLTKELEFVEVKGSRMDQARAQSGDPQEKVRNWLENAAEAGGHWAKHNMEPGMKRVAMELADEISTNGGQINARWAQVNLSNDANTGELLFHKTVEPWLSPAQRIQQPGMTPRRGGQRASPDDPNPQADIGPRTQGPTDDPDFNDVWFALHSHNEVAIQDALKRMMKTPEAESIMEQGRTELEAKDLQQAQTLAMQAEMNPDIAVDPEVERRRGPVMVMTLVNRHGPQGGPPGDIGGGGGDGGG
jgi:Holliday junction resolvase-like predicted endonuclease